MHPSNSFGIDHPLIAVHDINAIRARLQSLGFTMTPVGKHPWGTSTSLAMFKNCLLEIMGVYDDSLQDLKPAGEFRFGRHVIHHLQDREGVSLTALHSEDSLVDAQSAEDAGWNLSGHLEFGRDVTLPSGQQERTKTTLALLPDSKNPRLSFFLCQQHRRDLVEVADWMNHPNGAFGIEGISIKAPQDTHTELKVKFESIYGSYEAMTGGFSVDTANGYIRVLETDTLINNIGTLPECVIQDESPSIVAMEFKVKDLAVVREFVANAGMTSRQCEGQITLTEPSLLGNTVMQFRECHSETQI